MSVSASERRSELVVLAAVVVLVLGVCACVCHDGKASEDKENSEKGSLKHMEFLAIAIVDGISKFLST